MSPDYDIADPVACQLFEALRAFGYDLPTAVADLVDNSITATARNIWIDLEWAGQASRVIVRDDGRGMTEEKLVEAMRPGSGGPMARREPDDLGRFGLGMKTASISQCRCLTVLTKTAGSEPAIRRWDLDYLSGIGTGEWRLLKGSALLDAKDLALLDRERNGTVVFWDRLDAVVGDAVFRDEVTQRHFRERAEAIRDHLAMVFHRFLSGRDAIRIHINGRLVEPWDPFMETADGSDPLPSEILSRDDQRVEVKPFILPHHSRLKSEEHAKGGGPKGWNAHQGFYVYRNRRLLVAGDWLGLGMQKEEHFKLARIRIDLPNSADQLWQIDVKKSKARPPAALRKDLQRIARVARGRASSIYRHRGRVIQRGLGNTTEFVWKALTKHGKTFYKINREHPLVAKVLRDAGENRKNLRALLGLMEQTVPSPLIVIRNAEEPDTLGQPYEDASADLDDAMALVFGAITEEGTDPWIAAQSLLLMEPFNQFPDRVAAFLERVREQGNIKEKPVETDGR